MLEPLRQGLPPIDVAAAADSASFTLPDRYESVGEARQFTRETLLKWGLENRFDDVSLVVSELVTNALRHARPELMVPERQECAARLRLMRWNTRLVCAVCDPSLHSPRPRDPDPECAAESGRGLFLVESFSDTWGWHPLAGTLSGKVVWALFCLPDESARPTPE